MYVHSSGPLQTPFAELATQESRNMIAAQWLADTCTHIRTYVSMATDACTCVSIHTYFLEQNPYLEGVARLWIPLTDFDNSTQHNGTT